MEEPTNILQKQRRNEVAIVVHSIDDSIDKRHVDLDISLAFVLVSTVVAERLPARQWAIREQRPQHTKKIVTPPWLNRRRDFGIRAKNLVVDILVDALLVGGRAIGFVLVAVEGVVFHVGRPGVLIIEVVAKEVLELLGCGVFEQLVEELQVFLGVTGGLVHW